MGVRRVEELAAFQLTMEFKRAVYALLRGTPTAAADLPYRRQLCDAAASAESNLIEGFDRYRAGEIRLFCSYARASLAEAKGRLLDGVDRGYFVQSSVDPAVTLARRAGAAIAGFQRSLQPFTKSRSRKPPDDKRHS